MPQNQTVRHHQLKLNKLGLQGVHVKYGLKVFDDFECMTGVSVLLSSQLSVFHHNKLSRIQSDSISISTVGQNSSLKKSNNFLTIKEGFRQGLYRQ